MLFRHYLPDDSRAAFSARLALWAWTAALLAGGVTWLAGRVSGKVFLDWTGIARSLWAMAGREYLSDADVVALAALVQSLRTAP